MESLLTALGVCAQLLGFACRAALARALGAGGLGLWHLLLPAPGVLLALTAAGPAAAAFHLAARCAPVGRERALRRILRRCLRLYLLAAAPLLAAAAAFSGPVCAYLLGDGRARAGFLLLLPCALLTGAENVMKQLLRGAGRPVAPAAAEAGEQAAKLAAALALLLLAPEGGAARACALLAAAWTACEILSVSALLPPVRRLLRGGEGERGAAEDRRTDRRVTAVALPAGAGALAGSLLAAANAAAAPLLLKLGGCSREEAMAGFGRLSGMTAPLAALSLAALGPLLTVTVPRAARQHARGDRAGFARTARQALARAWTLSAAAAAVLCAVGREAGALLYGDARAAQGLPVLAAGTVCASLAAVLLGLLAAAGRPRAGAEIGAICASAQLAFTCLAAGPLGLGAAGLAPAMALADLLGLLLSVRAARRYLDISLRPGRGALIGGAAALLTGTTACLLRGCLIRAALPPAAVLTGTALFAALMHRSALAAMGWRR